MSDWARRQRGILVDALTALGPDAPTACEGWTTADMAAHLYIRERRIDAAPGVILSGPFAHHTERVMASVLRVHTYEHVVQRVADGPPLLLRPLDEVMNLFEYFVHAEDVRRANGEGPRELPDELERLMWRRLRPTLRVMYRRVRDLQIEFVAEHGDRTVIGTGPRVRLLGPVGELVLYSYNRKGIAQVQVSGDDDAVRRLRDAALGP